MICSLVQSSHTADDRPKERLLERAHRIGWNAYRSRDRRTQQQTMEGDDVEVQLQVQGDSRVVCQARLGKTL